MASKKKAEKSQPQKPKMVSTKPIFDKLGIGPEEAQKYMRGFLLEMERMKDEIELEEILKKPSLTPEEIWTMKPTTFHAWRVKYDLPRILAYFSEKLNQFNEWMNEYGIDNELLIRHGISNCVNLKDIKEKDKSKYIFYKKGDDPERDFLSFSNLSNKTSTMWGEAETFVLKKKFVGYLDWCEEKEIRAFGTRDNKEVFHYTSASNIRSKDIKISILEGFELLKVGGITVQPNAVGMIYPKYFEFVNASYLTLQGHFSSGGEVLRFENSIIDDLKCENLEYHLVEFNNCSLGNIRVLDSSIGQWSFYKTLVTGKVSNSKLSMIQIIGGGFIPILDSTHIQDVHAIHTNELGFTSTYQLLKKTYADQGDDRNAIKYFLKEKRLERKFLYKSIFDRQIRSRFKLSVWTKSATWLKYKTLSVFRYLFSLLNDLYWGYGRKPFNIVVFSLIYILICTLFYHFNQELINMPNQQTVMSFSDSFYYSTVSFTTLGYGDFSPKGFLRIIASSEALFGGMSIGFLVAGFSSLKY
jgi:hypothetical protein